MGDFIKLVDLSNKQLIIFFDVVSIINKLTTPYVCNIHLYTMIPKDLFHFSEWDFLTLVMNLESLYNIEIDDITVNSGISVINFVLYLEPLFEPSPFKERNEI